MTKSIKETLNTVTTTQPAFDITKALEVARSTSASASKSGALGIVNKSIIDLLEAHGAPLAINQIHASLNACGIECTKKNICDKAWNLAKNGKIAKTGLGMYAPNVTEA